ncbi:hypothetical protein H7I76_10840 [Mycolicibacterium vaccae]|nr:hypothetical protein [Mycolicibacterium vaccae]
MSDDKPAGDVTEIGSDERDDLASDKDTGDDAAAEAVDEPVMAEAAKRRVVRRWVWSARSC